MADSASQRLELRRAIRHLRDRGLYSAAMWAAEQLVGLPEVPSDSLSPRLTGSFGSPYPKTPMSTDSLPGIAADAGTYKDENEEEEDDQVLLGKALFDMREYRRAAHALRGLTGNKAFFLGCYSTYLAGEKRKEEEIVETAGPLGKVDVSNSELPALEQTLGSAFSQGRLDAFGAYLYGTILADRERKEDAMEALCASVTAFPWNWSAWLQLQALCTDTDTLISLQHLLPNHWMRSFFDASVLLDLHRNSEGLVKYRSLHLMFPRSDHIVAQTALAHYNLREFDEAESLFEGMLKTDPYRIENMDVYSNILYVKECFAALSFLAHKSVLTDKYRPETCCIIGNYYSLKAQHEKAVLYFKRALKLNRSYLSAWTLMGHEYVELKNTPAAISAYRRAVDINPRDYRAWYGLGQTYEILAMPYYALHYYRCATQLRPGDARMWCAMGMCYESESLSLPSAAIRCYRRAVQSSDREGIALHKLAKLHASLGQSEQAAFYFRKNLERIDSEQAEGPDLVEALLFLAQYLKARGGPNLAEAENFCTRLLDYPGPAKEDAKALLREIHSMRQHPGPRGDLDTDDL